MRCELFFSERVINVYNSLPGDAVNLKLWLVFVITKRVNLPKYFPFCD